MLRKRFKDVDLKITELADYLQLSRPTMYKFIEMYENKEFNNINKRVLKLFNYINDNEYIGKKNIVNYILNNLVDIKEVGEKDDLSDYKVVKKYMISNPDSEKTRFMINCSKKSNYDMVIHYLIEIDSLLKKKDLTETELEKIRPYKEIINMYRGDVE